VKKLAFAVVLMAVATSTAGAQNDANGHRSAYYYSADTYAPEPPGADQRFDPTAHYWDYYRVDQGHGIDVDRTTPP
jgi:hypothetical protein